jgi:hypothetical protein
MEKAEKETTTHSLTIETPGLAGLCGVATLYFACSRSNNLFLGCGEAAVGGHVVVVTDCYRASVPPPRRVDGPGEPAYRFTPCRDADVEIRREELVVNGVSYGPLNRLDSVLVDHGVVKIGRAPR